MEGDETGPPTAAPTETPGRTWHRRALYATVRGLIVLLVAAVVFPAVVPYTHVVRSRLARLVPARTGMAAYDKAKPQSGEQGDTATGVAALTAAAKKSPGSTGIYSIEWSPDQSSAAGVIGFLLPNAADATTALSQIEKQQLATNSYSSDSLARAATFAVAGVPGSSGSVYHTSAAGSGPPALAVTAFRYGREVAVTEIAGAAAVVQKDATSLSATEYAKLRQAGPNFSLDVTVTPLLPTVLWAVGAVVLAALVALVPVERRRRAAKRQRALEEEMANKIVVGRQVIAKHRI